MTSSRTHSGHASLQITMTSSETEDQEYYERLEQLLLDEAARLGNALQLPLSSDEEKLDFLMWHLAECPPPEPECNDSP